MGREERKKIIQQIEQNRNSKVFCYITSDRPNGAGQVAKDILNIFNDLLRIKDVYKKIDLFIFTLGGDILAGFGLSRLFREYTDYFSVLIPDKCYSAGTLLALGANEIVMTKAASLSPIDPTINNPLNPAIQQPGSQPQILPLSVESIAAFQSLVSDEWGIKKKDLLSEIFKLLGEKIHPISLGEAFKARQQIEKLAINLMFEHRNDRRKIKKIVHILTKELGSHDYPIHRREAKKIIGEPIVQNKEIENLTWELYTDFKKEMSLGVPFNPVFVPNKDYEVTIALVESLEEGKKISNTYFVKPPNANVQLKPGHWEQYS